MKLTFLEKILGYKIEQFGAGFIKVDSKNRVKEWNPGNPLEAFDFKLVQKNRKKDASHYYPFCKYCGRRMVEAPTERFDENTGQPIMGFYCPNWKCLSKDIVFSFIALAMASVKTGSVPTRGKGAE